MSAEEVDRYLAALDPTKRETLEQLRQTLVRLLPDAEQGLSYGVPAFSVAGNVIAGFSAAKHHLSYLPHSGSVLASLPPADLEGHPASKGALRFPIDTPLSGDLVAALVAARLAELAARAPRPATSSADVSQEDTHDEHVERKGP